ncbi:MAG: hypothetical protein DRQ51_06510 [Gammaproteobacteria bacterium]|nr:MAG: hypothetical protein DRQ51_06510 [Gammaproteobacteria bacterium]
MKQITKITTGTTNFDDLYQVFEFESEEELSNKKARLFSNGKGDDEVATTSTFLASLSAIKEYREELFCEIGVDKIKSKNPQLHVFTEMTDKKTGNRPDGLVVITSGKKEPVIVWAAFVEAKVDDNKLDEKQISKYAEYGKKIGITNILTISNELVTNQNESPVKIKQRSVDLFHWSWIYLKVMAKRLIGAGKVADEDHIYLLKELRRYFDSHKKVSSYSSMGGDWKKTVDEIHDFAPNKNIKKPFLDIVIDSYQQEEKDIALQLTDNTGFHIELVTKKDENREKSLTDMLQDNRTIISKFMVNKNKDLIFFIEVNFISRIVECYTIKKIPDSVGKSVAQTSTLLNMLSAAGLGDDIKIRAFYKGNISNGENIPLSVLNTEQDRRELYSILDNDRGDTVKNYKINMMDKIAGNFSSPTKFVERLENNAKTFVEQVMGNLK